MSEITEQSPVLVLPEDETRRVQLQQKFGEYKARFKLYRAPELQMGTICKITVLECLLQNGRVDTWELCLEMVKTYGSGFDPDKFGVACAVIEDYCKTGGKNAHGGTGLPNVDLEPSQ